jgi:hypothetical protein
MGIVIANLRNQSKDWKAEPPMYNQIKAKGTSRENNVYISSSKFRKSIIQFQGEN